MLLNFDCEILQVNSGHSTFVKQIFIFINEASCASLNVVGVIHDISSSKKKKKSKKRLLII